MEIRTAFDRACSSYARPPNSWIDADAARAHITAASIRAAWIRLRALPHRADPGVRGRAAVPDQRSGAAVRAHRLHGALQHVGTARGVDQLRLHEGRPADRAADRRQTLRRSRRAAACTQLRNNSAGATAVAPPAPGITPACGIKLKGIGTRSDFFKKRGPQERPETLEHREENAIPLP